MPSKAVLTPAVSESQILMLDPQFLYAIDCVGEFKAERNGFHPRQGASTKIRDRKQSSRKK